MENKRKETETRKLFICFATTFSTEEIETEK